ncbi:helix-turn-helix domain-containing protein [Halogeometricum luteum]|uniref:helix-turn-helix domain-containing protein n=1 Tax=Halogeometricum luteum TaxID=2950537 RepID=UPI003CCD860E
MGCIQMDSHETLSEQERELLQLAIEEGYFEVPRRISLVELSTLAGLTDTETSRRLRRALDTHLRATLDE